MSGSQFFDGLTARPHAVRADLAGDRLRLEADDGQYWTWPLAGMRLVRAQDGRHTFAPDGDSQARLVVADTTLGRHIAEAVRRRAAPGRRRRAALVAGLALGTPLLLAGLLWYGVPLAARPLARLVPDAWAAALGRQVAGHIVGSAPACEAAAGAAALQRLIRRLLPAGSAAEHFDVRVVRLDRRNAFAVPGRRIVLLSGLLRRAGSAEEVAGVLAHELGHALLGHPMQRAVQVLGVGLAVQALTGTDRLAGAAGTAAASLLLGAYSRDDERAADRQGLALLAGAGITADGLAAFFESAAGQADGPPAWLSTHPSGAERLALLRDAAVRGGGAAMSDADWRALRAICG